MTELMVVSLIGLASAIAVLAGRAWIRRRRAIDTAELVEELADLEHRRWLVCVQYFVPYLPREVRMQVLGDFGPYAALGEAAKEDRRAAARRSLSVVMIALDRAGVSVRWRGV